MDYWGQSLTALAQNSPYAFTVLFVLLIFFLIHKESLKQLNRTFDKSYEEIKDNNRIVLEEMRKTMQTLSKSQK